jgi:protein-S-isoprenylcysteine O-methyltransferase Ste14
MLLMLFTSLTVLFWSIFIVYWAVSAVNVKRNISQKSSWRTFFLVRIIFIIAVIWLLNQKIFVNFWTGAADFPIFSNTIAQIIGVILCGAGIALAIWARLHLGRNWSGTPQMKEGHELVTSGPYRFVRHPIYTGMIVALFGSAIVSGPGWFVVFFIASIVFVMRIKTEEGYMMKLFPNRYPEYRKKTKALIPFVW